MKELSIEEKAKRYDEALERAKELHSEDAPRESMDACEYIFPELAESKDEKIKQLLIRFVKYDMSDNYSDDFTPSDCIAWLEKQCEQKPSEDEDREYACQSSEHFTRRELMIYNRGIADGKRMIEDTIKETEQKPAWSEEDEEIKNIISGTLDLIYEKNICFENKSKNDCMFWLNSLIMRVQPQPKQEWSEEDEAAYNKALDAYYYKDLNDKDDVVFALKNLTDLIAKHRKTIPPYQRWKPTKEQMDALKRAHNRYDLCNICGIGVLESLYKDLEKLM